METFCNDNQNVLQRMKLFASIFWNSTNFSESFQKYYKFHQQLSHKINRKAATKNITYTSSPAVRGICVVP